MMFRVNLLYVTSRRQSSSVKMFLSMSPPPTLICCLVMSATVTTNLTLTASPSFRLISSSVAFAALRLSAYATATSGSRSTAASASGSEYANGVTSSGARRSAAWFQLRAATPAKSVVAMGRTMTESSKSNLGSTSRSWSRTSSSVSRRRADEVVNGEPPEEEEEEEEEDGDDDEDEDEDHEYKRELAQQFWAGEL